ncbi:MAG: bifunctional enoyl-CoA hydratase/phosphate acetyltransferase [Paracoccaceae bacterium]|jgi:phosphate acetyltransferase|nr:bifunctional enoyl-CoA hydratase/phosphate acetyltransferase [Paracoccaceae bacterium]MDP5346305.1 bifunctional enoyl-CoA hydratase/phosphate acetyltransferase [Paracoccaceae bacterium]
MDWVENRLFCDIRLGDTAVAVQTLSRRDVALYANMAGEPVPPLSLGGGTPPAQDRQSAAQGLWATAKIAALITTQLPGPGAVVLEQSLQFHAPCLIDAPLKLSLSVQNCDSASLCITLGCRMYTDSGTDLVTGTILVRPAPNKIRLPATHARQMRLHDTPGAHLHALIAQTEALPPLRTAVVHPCDGVSLTGALAARDAGLITPVLVGPRAKIMATATEAGQNLAGIEIHDAAHSHDAAQLAVALARHGQVGALMKGKLHSDELLSAVLDPSLGLRTERRLSHVFAIDVPDHPRLLFITDAAINISPDLGTLRDIVQNAIDLAQNLGITCPKVALLSAVETVTEKLPSTLLAAAICKMHDRGQITGGVVDGPLAYDNAISQDAARAKGIISPVAGCADVLVVPNIESGNMVAKQLIHLSGAASAGIVLGARVPIMLTSRADGVAARLASAALACLMAATPPAHRSKEG